MRMILLFLITIAAAAPAHGADANICVEKVAQITSGFLKGKSELDGSLPFNMEGTPGEIRQDQDFDDSVKFLGMIPGDPLSGFLEIRQSGDCQGKRIEFIVVG